MTRAIPKAAAMLPSDFFVRFFFPSWEHFAHTEHMAQIADTREGMQLSFFQLDDPVLCQVRDEILGLDVNNLTPL